MSRTKGLHSVYRTASTKINVLVLSTYVITSLWCIFEISTLDFRGLRYGYKSRCSLKNNLHHHHPQFNIGFFFQVLFPTPLCQLYLDSTCDWKNFIHPSRCWTTDTLPFKPWMPMPMLGRSLSYSTSHPCVLLGVWANSFEFHDLFFIILVLVCKFCTVLWFFRHKW